MSWVKLKLTRQGVFLEQSRATSKPNHRAEFFKNRKLRKRYYLFKKFKKGLAKVSIIIPNPQLHESPQYSKINKCRGRSFFLIKLSPICPGAAPRTPELTHSSQGKINAVDTTFSWWNWPLLLSQALFLKVFNPISQGGVSDTPP